MKTILVVDDELDILEIFVDLLGGEDQTILPARDGQAALELLAKHPVDLVITDTMMPRLGGVELIRRMRSVADLQDIPVILMSAAGPPSTNNLGNTAFLPKPFELDMLLEMVASAVG